MEQITGTAADHTISYTDLELGGKTYHLLFNLRALAKAQAATGINFLHGINFSALDAEKFAALLHAGLANRHPDVTLDQIMDQIDIRDMTRIAEAVGRAYIANQMESKNPPVPAAND